MINDFFIAGFPKGGIIYGAKSSKGAILKFLAMNLY